MLNLSAILNFYESKKNGNCMYVEKYGSLTGLKCQHKTVSLFCEEHEYKGIDEKKAVQFLLQLTENPEMLNEILKNISYYSFHHKEEGRLCEEINCTDCDHDDREFECKADITTDLCEIFTNSQESQLPSISQTSQLPSISQTSQLSSISQTSQLPTISQTSQLPTISQTRKRPAEIRVEPYENNLFRDINSGFILKQTEYDVYLMIDETEKYLNRKLNVEDLQDAKMMGLQII